MFAAIGVGDADSLLARIAQHHLAEVAPGGPGRVARGGRQGVDQRGHPRHRRLGQGVVGADQPARAFVPMFHLRDQIDGDDFGIRRRIGNHRHLGRAGKDVDAHLAVELPLGFGDELVARSNHDIRGLAGGNCPSNLSFDDPRVLKTPDKLAGRRGSQ